MQNGNKNNGGSWIPCGGRVGWTVRSHQEMWVHELGKQRQRREGKWWGMKSQRVQRRAGSGFTCSCCSEAAALRTRSLSSCTSGGSSPGCSLFCWGTTLLCWILPVEEESCLHWESLPKRFVFVIFFSPGRRQRNPKFICPLGAQRAGRGTQGSLSCSTDSVCSSIYSWGGKAKLHCHGWENKGQF